MKKFDESIAQLEKTKEQFSKLANYCNENLTDNVIQNLDTEFVQTATARDLGKEEVGTLMAEAYERLNQRNSTSL